MASNSASSALQQALDLLSPALGILDSFAHRNKNQHRLSKWWAQFDMLRRGARKLAADLRACLESQARASTINSKKKKSAAAQKERNDALTQKMETRARHLREQIVPRAFLYVARTGVCDEKGRSKLTIMQGIHAVIGR
jgi:ribonuclease MRP protein subunit RMP1